jgi:SRSO17 transposase
VSPQRSARPLARRFSRYLEKLEPTLGHADRLAPFRAYVTGLLLPGDRKSVESMAARVAPDRVRAMHQSMHHFVASSPWSADALISKVRELVLPSIEEHGAITSWIIDDTGMPKKGTHSVGVARQYCGQVGKQDNCQVAVSLSIANDFASLPIAYRLYLPRTWSDDRSRRRTAGVPATVRFATKPEIALAQLQAACVAEVPRGVVIADAAYGQNTAFREQIAGMDLRYMLAVQSNTTIWRVGEEPLLPKQKRHRGVGRRRTVLQRRRGCVPVSVLNLAQELAPKAFREITWREGTHGALRSRFAAVRVHAAHRDELHHEIRPQEWLLIEWPPDEAAPRKYWLSNLPETTSLGDLVTHAQRRWRIERDYQELKDEIGLDHFEGRSWRGFHHHAALCIAAYGSLVAERGVFSPADIRAALPQPALPSSFEPRGSARAR